MAAEHWQWFGDPLHFIAAWDCHFHLATMVGGGRWIVSTVGRYHPDRPMRSRRMVSEGEDAGEDVGYGRKFETMVFAVGGFEPCGCPTIDPCELDFWGGNTHAAANAAHVRLCRKWDELTEIPTEGPA